MSAATTPTRAADDPEVRAALDRVSAVVQRALLRIEQNRMRAAAESPPAEPPPRRKKKAGAPPQSAGRTASTTTATTQACSHLEVGHDR